MVLADAPLAVDGVGAVRVVCRRQAADALPADGHAADTGALAQFPVDASNRVVVAVEPAHRRRLHVEHAHVEAPRLARKPAAVVDRDQFAPRPDADAAAEEQVDAGRSAAAGSRPDGEQAGVLQEEGPLLGEEQVEPVEVHLLLVDLDLGEVRVVGQVERETRRHAVLEVDTEVGVGLVLAAGAGRLAARSDRVGDQLQVALRWRLDAPERPRVGQPVQVVVPVEFGPEGNFPVARDVALEVQAPGLHLFRRIAEGAEGNRELRAPAELADLGGDGPGAVPVQVEAGGQGAAPEAAVAAHAAEHAGAAFHDLAVVLDARRVRAEHETVAAVLERVEDDLEAVRLVQGRVAAAVRDDDPFGFPVVADDRHEEGVLGVREADLGPFRARLAGEGPGLRRAGSGHDGLPDRIVENPAVKLGRLSDRQGGSRWPVGLGFGRSGPQRGPQRRDSDEPRRGNSLHGKRLYSERGLSICRTPVASAQAHGNMLAEDRR